MSSTSGSGRPGCCAGPITLIDTTTEAPADSGDFVDVPARDLMVRYRGDPEAGPHVLTIELRGALRLRLVSFWDGCAFKPLRTSLRLARLARSGTQPGDRCAVSRPRRS